MAIINNTFGFIFIHVPKAAGTSVTNALSEYTNYCDLEIGGTAFGEKVQPLYRNRFGLYKHIPANELKNITGTKDWVKFFTFSIVRHPADRLLSIYNFLKQWEGTPAELKSKLFEFDTFNAFVLSEVWKRRPGPDNIFFPQTYWLTDKAGLLVNYVGKIEQLDESLNFIKEVIGLKSTKNLKLSKLNESKGEKDFTEISDEAKSLINDYYTKDFEIFDYEKLL
ncbi:sulfotransferase family 2 domain-containing protein [Alteromonas stellipolaris]|uniref:sulfotransferase family 2 domain-containing protein n=1 Tax=Alteromonas stellipolaris TaxID=233316 RepID=UPI001D2BF3D5|nr:sulfotransferase family 2 domain-containing protein [Alteromonas stellipolaris]MBZ2163619.1 sulfotransferase family protein [Alteromonas stellipolaris]